MTIQIEQYGWRRQSLDFNDYPYVPPAPPPPDNQGLRVQLPLPFWDQGRVGSCTAHATDKAALHTLARAGVPLFDPARLFQYYNSRALEHTTRSDAGATIRDAIKAINQYGMAPADLWPYDPTKVTRKPPKRAYAAALKDVALEYYAVAQRDGDMRACLAEGYPIVIGFSVFPSFESPEVARTGMVPLPRRGEQPIGGHSVLVDEYAIIDGQKYAGIWNSWGADWGQGGRAYLPWGYLLNPRLASDFWMLKRVGQA